MTTTTASISTPSSSPDDREVSRLRLYILRATYLLLAVALGLMIVPALIHHEPMARGVIPSLLGGVWLLAIVGLRFPLQMLPVLMFELAWKAIWLFRLRLAAMACRSGPANVCRGLQGDCGRGGPDAALDPLGLCLPALHQGGRS